MTVDVSYLLDVLQRLIATPSPVGHTGPGLDLCTEVLCDFDFGPGYHVSRTPKGVLSAMIPGNSEDAPRAITAHIDTLGAQVKEIKSSGKLQLAKLGGFDWSSIENENVTVETVDGSTFTGTLLYVNPSYHVHKPDDRIDNKPRDDRYLEVRLDARVSSRSDVQNLGIAVGDYVHFATRYEVRDGFVKSRFLDDKACLACVFAALKVLQDTNQQPAQRTQIHIPNYEEVCHGGASGVAPGTDEVLAVDVAPLGTGQNSDEFSCTLCTLDDDGPYDYELNRKLHRLAREHDVALRPDVFIQFSSDAKALWKAGGDARVSLIGPGVDNTHGYERTHVDALVATTRLIVAYLLDAK
jgi:putative aminopeptidase FrvX